MDTWCRILNTYLIGLHILPDNTRNGKRYRHFLEFTLPPLLDNVTPLQLRRDLKCYQRDDAPARNASIAARYLTETRAGKIDCLARAVGTYFSFSGLFALTFV